MAAADEVTQATDRMPKQLKDGPAKVRLPMVVSETFARRLDEWRRDQPDFPNRSEAIRRMAEAAFDERESQLDQPKDRP